MPTTTELGSTPRRDLHIFYVLDTSGSMSGAPIQTLNRAMRETIAALKAETQADSNLKIAALEFNTKCRWVTMNGPEDVEDFFWDDLKAGGLTSVGAALEELDAKMSRSAFLNSMTGAYLPVIIFMTDGRATDEYQAALAKIRQNKWFSRGTKIGFAVGDDADRAMVEQIVGNSEAVISTNDLKTFANMLRRVSVTSSMLNSQSRTTEVAGTDVVRAATAAQPSANAMGTASGAAPATQPDPDPAWDGAADFGDDTGW